MQYLFIFFGWFISWSKKENNGYKQSSILETFESFQIRIYDSAYKIEMAQDANNIT